MRLRYKLGLVLITLSMAVCFMLYQSYALWIVSLHGTENTISVGCFAITYEELNENPSIQLKNTYPMKDSKGLEQTPYKFKVKNNCSILSRYVVTLNTLTTNHIKAGLNKEINQEFPEFDLKDKIKFALVEGSNATPENGTNLGEYAKVVSHINTDLENLSVNNLAESIILATGVLGAQEEQTYSLYLWYDESAGNEIMGHSFEASVNIINRATSSTENQESIFPETVIDELDDAGNGLITQTHEDYEGKEEGWKIDELRFVGPDPHNYIEFNGEQDKWRIIGLVNVKTTNGTYDQRIKIIRESIGNYSWDTSESGINNGEGVNEWGDSDIMKLLNPSYDGESHNNSLYWNGGNGTCYDDSNDSTSGCDFSDKGLSKSQDYISDDIVWNTGTNGNNDYVISNGLAKHFYEYERSKNNGKICDSGNYCNDEVPRTIEWKSEEGKKALVGLMYPSDYGYATGGGVETNRTSCLDIGMYNWNGSEDCYNNDWLYDENDHQWIMSPSARSERATYAFYVYNAGCVYGGQAYNAFAIRPVVYLKSNVTFSGGEGIIGNNFKIS